MTVTAQAGLFGFGIQAAGAKGGAVTNWYRHRSLNIDLAELDDVRVAPPEIGDIPAPSAAYKAGVMNSGGVTLFPRLTSTFGWLLLGVMGASDFAADVDMDAAAHIGLNTHTFRFHSSNKSYVPYMGFRKLIPADTDADELGVEYKDGKIASMVFNFPNDDLISTRLDVLAREFTYVPNPMPDVTPPWTFANTFEDFESIPVGAVQGGSIKFNSVTLPVVAATVSMTNVPLDLRQERVYGSPFLHGITVVNRAMTFDLIVRWENPQLYRQVITNSASGTAWSPITFTGPVVLDTQTPDVIGTAPLDVPWRLRLEAPRVLLAQNGPVALASGQSVLMRFNGTALVPPSGEYATIKLQNEQPQYSVPA